MKIKLSEFDKGMVVLYSLHDERRCSRGAQQISNQKSQKIVSLTCLKEALSRDTLINTMLA